MIPPEGRTVDGFETQYRVNLLAHFLLAQLLKNTLITSTTPELPSLIVMVSSSGHRASKVLFDDYNFTNNGYEPLAAYGQSKKAMIWPANELDRRYGALCSHAHSLHLGNSAS
ncbi:hypothetical protein BDV09DRAFT_91463 [Aspergillus tetrazonus]